MTSGALRNEPPLKRDSSLALFNEARKYEPNGTQGDGKFFAPFPIFNSRGLGSRLWDADGNEYIDYWNGAGPTVLGHSHPAVNQAVKEMMDQHGVQFCAPHPWEIDLARRISEVVPSAEMSAFGCGGSDALCYAVRAARSYTGRTKILKFEGSYHGWYDGVLFNVTPDIEQAGQDDAPRSLAHSSGLIPDLADHITILPYNNADLVADLFAQDGKSYACLIVEPVIHTHGCILPKPGFLKALRELCDQHGVVLIFDEILTGFRHHIGGCQILMDVKPDLTGFGKAMSNGFPICSLSGKREIMSSLAPEGTAFFSGTYNGNILCVAAALKTLEILSDGTVHKKLWALGKRMADGLNSVAARLDIRMRCANYGSACSVQFTRNPPENYRDLMRGHDKELNRRFTEWMLDRGIYTMPRRVNRFYISAAHNEQDIDRTIEVAEAFMVHHQHDLR